jgi:hypothetical protein
MVNLDYSISNIILAFATMIGAFGGFPAPPKLFLNIASYGLIQWFLVFVLLYQGGGGQDIVLSAIITGITFLVYKFIRHFEGTDDDELVLI